jgi:tetratricopeptide (TPR) repeat protein/ribonuclease BN (tRNA processing enzyme)
LLLKKTSALNGMPRKSIKTSAISPAVLTKFKELFEKARQEHFILGDQAASDNPAHLKAFEYARAKKIPGAETLLDCLLAAHKSKLREQALPRLSEAQTVLPPGLLGYAHYTRGLVLSFLDQHDQAIQCYLQALATPGYATPGDAHYNLGNAYADKEDWDRAIECYQQALETPGYATPGNAHNNLGIAYADKGDWDRAIECYQQALATPGYTSRGDAHYNMGIAYRRKEDWDRAIECFQQALETPGYAIPGEAHNNLGNAYAAKGDWDRAIECYQKALTTPGYPTPGAACYNQGNAYAAKSDLDRAIECYLQALATPGYATPGNAHNNLGIAYADKGDLDRAIECYQQALATPGYANPGNAHNNLGNAYADKRDWNRAIECYQQALATPGYASSHLCLNNLALALQDKSAFEEALLMVQKVLDESRGGKEYDRALSIKKLIEEARMGVEPTLGEEALVKEDRSSATDSLETQILKKLGQQELGQKDKYDRYLQKEASGRDNVFSCLRGWSSAVTLLEGRSNSQWQGGGYFFKWKAKGVVLDPGFDFIDNFHEAGYNMREVDAVLVSHNHSDHNYDLGSLDDLRYELHRRWKTLPEDKQKEFDVSRCLFVVDEDTADSFRDDCAAHRGTAMKFTASDRERKRWIKQENELPFTVEHFKAKHGNDVPRAVGMRVIIHDENKTDFVIGYTGDTEYFDTLASHLQNCDILLAHISMPNEEELLDPDEFEKKRLAGELGKLTSDGYKRNHLGYRGLIKLVQETQPKMVLVGEFWAGLEDIRIDLIRGIRHQVKTVLAREIPILPTGIGFHLQLPTLQVECTACRKFTPYEWIKVAPATSPFGPLGYLCPGCLI